MKRLAQATNATARRNAWLWRNRLAFANAGPAGCPRLLADVSAIIRHDAQTGIQRVVRAVWSELARRNSGDFEAIPVYATNNRGYCYAPKDFLERNGGALPNDPAGVQPGDQFLGLDLSALWLPKYRKQLKAWREHGAMVNVVVYDLLPLLSPEWFTPSTVKHFRRWYDVLANDVDRAICISDEVAREVRQRIYRAGESRQLKVCRLQMAADISASVPSTGLCDGVTRLVEQLRFRPGVLMVGTIEPRKGYDAALASFEHLWRDRPKEAPDLVIVGKAGWKTGALQERLRSHPELGRRMHWFDDVSDEGLCLLYDACCGVLMASRGEGFGLPLIEAAMHRRHVLARDLPVFREQGLLNMIYFTDESPTALGERLIELAHLGQRQAAPPLNLSTWSESVDGLLAELGFIDLDVMPAEPRLRIAS